MAEQSFPRRKGVAAILYVYNGAALAVSAKQSHRDSAVPPGHEYHQPSYNLGIQFTMPTAKDIRIFMKGQAFGSTHIPKDTDFSGKTVVITGANTGLGFECAKHMYGIVPFHYRE
jgi:hypothetical protein